MTGKHKLKRIGWREWVGLPQLGLAKGASSGVGRIKAKIDTGARTSAVHAFGVTPFVRDGREFVRFSLHPVQKRRIPEVRCEAEVLEQRLVTSSSGQRELRYVIMTELTIGEDTRSIELTLANRDQLGFRLLVGREAVRGHYVIDPGSSYRMTRRTKKKVSKRKKKAKPA